MSKAGNCRVLWWCCSCIIPGLLFPPVLGWDTGGITKGRTGAFGLKPSSLWERGQGWDWVAVLPVGYFYYQGDAVREIWHYQYLSWPDHGVPSEPGGVLSFLDQINQKQESIPAAGPILVHCRLVQRLGFEAFSIPSQGSAFPRICERSTCQPFLLLDVPKPNPAAC